MTNKHVTDPPWMVVRILVIPWPFGWDESPVFVSLLTVSVLFFVESVVGSLSLGRLFLQFRIGFLKSVWKLIVLLSPCQSYSNWGLHKVKNIAEEPLFQHLLAVLKLKEWPCTVSIFLKVYILVQLQAFKNCALSFFQLVLRSQKFNSKMAQAFSFPPFIRYNSLVQSQARELSLQRQQIKDSHDICVIYRQHMSTMIKAFEELLQASDVDYYVAEGFQEQLNQCAELLEKLEKLFLNGKWAEALKSWGTSVIDPGLLGGPRGNWLLGPTYLPPCALMRWQQDHTDCFFLPVPAPTVPAWGPASGWLVGHTSEASGEVLPLSTCHMVVGSSIREDGNWGVLLFW